MQVALSDRRLFSYWDMIFFWQIRQNMSYNHPFSSRLHLDDLKSNTVGSFSNPFRMMFGSMVEVIDLTIGWIEESLKQIED